MHYQVPSYNRDDVDLNGIRVWDGEDWVTFDWDPILAALKQR